MGFEPSVINTRYIPLEVICSEELSHCPLSESVLPHQHCLLSKNKASRQIKKPSKMCKCIEGKVR